MQWDLRAGGEEAVHCIGNGHVCAYGRGLEICQLFGPHYNGPNAAAIRPAGPLRSCGSRRVEGAAVWVHRLEGGGTATDFASVRRPVFVRLLDGGRPTAWDIETAAGFWKPLSPVLAGSPGAFWTMLPAGTPFYSYSDYPCPGGYVITEPILMGVLAWGADTAAADSTLNVTLAGAGGLAVAFAASMEELTDELRAVLRETPEALQAAAEEDGRRFTARYRRRQPLPGDLAAVADDVATMIRCQQAASGGVLAGPNYHMAYLRDNYGALRGLLSMGCHEEAAALVRFYMDTFRRYGRVQNAQGTGGCTFHIHEHDEVEITGYMVLMVSEYARATGDDALLREARELLWWCAQAQHGLLRDGMLPFNGDETYIAGSLLPRTAIDDGSMEATALYHEACTRLLANAKALELTTEQVQLLEADKRAISAGFDAHFVQALPDGRSRLTVNCPGYPWPAGGPSARHGVYLCGHGVMGVCGARNADGWLVCADCADKVFPELNEQAGRRYVIPSALLMPVFAGVALPEGGHRAQAVDAMMAAYRAAGCLTGQPGGTMVGYEYGALLYALARMPGREADVSLLRAALLDCRDASGVWTEYYATAAGQPGQPRGCPCRPWESGISITALIDTRAGYPS